MSTIYLPGRGVVNLTHRAVDEAVHAYDERLFAATHPHTGNDTIFVKMPPHFEDGIDIGGQRCLPILAFPEGFPHTDDVLKRIYQADAVRRGDEILREIHRHNDRIKAEKEYESSERAGELAEVIASYRHRNGETPYHTSMRKAPRR